ncbi:MAG: peptidylprolyl isomerase [Deltaproteobacteria bacterium]|nr:peptidylprolyl isomerase [Deltaproteobacteria bacterium]
MRRLLVDLITRRARPLALAGALAIAAPQVAPTAARAAEFPPESRIADRIVAIVNSEPVTLYELRRAASPQVARAMREIGRDPKKLDLALRRIVKETLDALVDDILIAEEAKAMDLAVQPEKVDAHLAKIKEANGWTDDELSEELGKLGFASITDYRRHTEREMLKSQVVGIKVASRVKVEESEVEAALKQQLGSSGQVEERRAAHILIRLDELATPEAEARAKETLEAARQKIAAGELTFAQAAKDLSDDTNKNAGGDLGWFTRGDFDPDFEKVAFALKKDEVSAPFRTRFGMHIVLIEDLRSKTLANEKELETLRRQIRFALREQALERVYGQWVRSLRTDAFVQIKDLGLGGASEPAPQPEPPREDAPDDGAAPDEPGEPE